MAKPHPPAQIFIPEKPTLDSLWQAAQGCRACELYKTGTQAVLGEGPRRASAFFIGEQPGDQEDLAGKPFVGPAGRVLDEALEEVGIPRAEIYVTNAVKHFKWEPRGKRRIHQKPTLGEVKACRPWLETELALVRPKVIVCLGATAAQSLLGPQFRITRDHGLFFETPGRPGPRLRCILPPFSGCPTRRSASMRGGSSSMTCARWPSIFDLAERVFGRSARSFGPG